MPGYFSEVRYEGGSTNDFIEIVVPTGTDVSAYTVGFYDKFGVYVTSWSLGTIDATIGGNDVYVLTPADPGFLDIHHNDTLALVDNTGTVIQLLANTVPLTLSGGPADGMTGFSSGVPKTLSTESIQSDDGGATYYMQTAPNAASIPCYAPGTLIDTPEGPRMVEDLKVGDLVNTVDHGPLPIRWVRQGDQPLEGVDAGGRPVLIRKGAFGPGRPLRDLVVSPQHRILVGGLGQLDGVFRGQVFAPAKALVGLPRIRAMMGKTRITWHHFALERHAVVRAEGCFSESLLLGPMVVNGLSGMQRRALAAIYGEVAAGGELNGPAARECLAVGAVVKRLSNWNQSQAGAAA